MTQDPGSPPAGAGEPLLLADVADDPLLAVALVAELQAEHGVRCGGPDETPVDPADSTPPRGAFLVALVDGEPVGTAGLRALGGGIVELERMHVRPADRCRGHARRLLAAVEERGRDGGYRRVVLETGTRQPEAVALCAGAGCAPVEPHGHCAGADGSIHLGPDLRGSGADGRG